LVERKNLADAKPEVLKELVADLDEWESQMVAPRWLGFSASQPAQPAASAPTSR